MISNLGFTLTPDSMISFRDAGWPMFTMSFLAFAGNTLYPVFLRLVIWTMSKVHPRNASIQQPLTFLLDHPRRCYTLLFPRGATWALFGIVFVLNFVDTLLIIVLDLNNSAVSELPLGPRILAAIFQAASSRHTGTATFNLAEVNPAVQFSLLVMMYIAIFPIAMTVRVSNTYEERSLGVYESDGQVNEQKGSAYLLTHMQNQLSFDLWYMFLGIFCICVAESRRIMDVNEPVSTVARQPSNSFSITLILYRLLQCSRSSLKSSLPSKYCINQILDLTTFYADFDHLLFVGWLTFVVATLASVLATQLWQLLYAVNSPYLASSSSAP